MLLRHQRIHLLTLAAVILFCYSLSAIFKEKVLRRPYGEGEGERFTFVFAFTAVQCIVYASVAKAVITVRGETKNETPQRFFCIIGVFYVLGKVTAYMSLRYVPYPTSVVGKSAKPIPVMLLGVLIGRKTYTMYKYIFVTIVVIGVALFTFKEKYDKKDGEDPILGIIFIGVSLLMDGFLGAFEDRMRSVKKPTPLNLMLYMDSWTSLYLIVYLVTTSEGVEFLKFCQRHPIVIRDLSVITFFGIFGQFGITSMISHFGALPLSITTTIRKFVTVLLSVIIFNNVLSIRQWIAASIIFIALFLDGHFSRKGKKKAKEENGEITDGKESVGNHIENGGETIKKEVDIEKSAIENEEKCEKRIEHSSLKRNPNQRRTVRVSFEGDMLDMLDEINYAFEDSDDDTKDKVEASKEQSQESTTEVLETTEKNGDVLNTVGGNKESIAVKDEKEISTENQIESEMAKNIVDPVHKASEKVDSQENLTETDHLSNSADVPKQYPELEKEVDTHSPTITNNKDLYPVIQEIDNKLEHVNEAQPQPEGNKINDISEIICDSSDDTKL